MRTEQREIVKFTASDSNDRATAKSLHELWRVLAFGEIAMSKLTIFVPTPSEELAGLCKQLTP